MKHLRRNDAEEGQSNLAPVCLGYKYRLDQLASLVMHACAVSFNSEVVLRIAVQPSSSSPLTQSDEIVVVFSNGHPGPQTLDSSAPWQPRVHGHLGVTSPSLVRIPG